MTTSVLRREFLKTGGALIIGFSLRGASSAQSAAQGTAQTAARGTKAGPPDAKQIDTWLAIHSDNTATVYLGFVELGQGNSTALPQIAAEELDFGMNQVSTVRIDTNVTPNQGGTYSSASIARGGPQVRTAAAEARAALLEMASKKLKAPVERLTVQKGIVSVMGSPERHVSYGELVGDKPFNLAFTGKAPIKWRPPITNWLAYRLRGGDTPDKVAGKYVYMQHARVDGMLHGRVVLLLRGDRGAYGTGAKVLAVDEESIRNIPGAHVLRKGDFLGVVAESEWGWAIRAAQQLKVTWDSNPSLPGNEGLYEKMRAGETQDKVVLQKGVVAVGLEKGPHVVSFHARAPYQAHAPFGPYCALADVKADSAVVMSSTQDVYGTRNTLAKLLGLPVDKVRVQYYEGSGTYGHSCYDDVAQASAVMSQLAAKPVRLQFMRWDELGWDNYGPAHVGEVRAAADANGKITAYEYEGWHHNWSNVETTSQLTGVPAAEWPTAAAQQVNPLASNT